MFVVKQRSPLLCCFIVYHISGFSLVFKGSLDMLGVGLRGVCMRFAIYASILFLTPFAGLHSDEGSTQVQETESVVILGGGVGALTSALYLSRAGIKPIILEGSNPGGLITQSHLVQNWPGELEISGSDLVDKMRKQALANGAEFRAEEAIAVDFSKRPFTITTRLVGRTDEVRQIQTESCIIAMGTQSNYLGVPGETGVDGYWGKGVSNCAICDGTFYRDRIVGIVGGGDAAVLEGLYLSQIAKEVYIFVRKDSFKAVEAKRLDALLAKENVHVFYETAVLEIQGDGKQVTQVVLKTRTQEDPFQLSLDGLFLAIGSRPNSQVFQNVLKLDDAGYIHLQKDQETSIEGVYAIGDIVDPVYKQAISAAGDGAKAAIQVQKYLSDRTNLLIAKGKSKSSALQAKLVSDRSNPSIKDCVSLAASPSYLASSAGVIEINSKEQFEKELKETRLPVVVDFYATWCGPCKSIAPVFEHSASNFSGKMKFIKVNVDKFFGLSQSYQVTSMPTVLVLDTKGSVIDRRVGAEAIFDLLKNLDTQIE